MAALVVTSRLVPIQIRASSSVSTSQLPSLSSSFTVKYLVDSCGLELQSAIAASRKLYKKKLNENNIHRSDSVLNLLESYGFERTHIVEIIRKRPDMLTHFRSGKFLRPKLEYLVEMGISGSDLYDLIAMNPNILFVGLNSKLKSRFESLRDCVGTNERARAALMVCPWLLNEDNWKPNFDVLLREGVAVDNLFKLIARKKMAMKRNVDEMVCAIEIVRKLGINPATDKFLNAVLVVANVPLWEKKVKVFSDFGLSAEEIMSILRLRPNRFDYSEKRLRCSFEFLVNTMNMNPKTISSHPTLLSYAIDKWVRPRCNVVKLLWSMKLLGEGDAKLARALVKTEERFLKDYVYKYLYLVPNLLDVYRGEITTKKIPNLERLATLFENRASSSVSTSQLPSSSSSFTVKYLVNWLQMQPAIAASPQLSQKLNETNIHRSYSVLNLFKSYGLDATHVAEIIRKRPRILHDYDGDKKFRPKMEYLVEIGFSGSVLGDLIAMNPDILMFGLNSRIKPNFESLRDSLGSNERAKAALMACPFLLTKNDWTPFVDLLIREGVAVDNLVGHIVGRKLDILQKADGMGRAVDIVKNLGINLGSPKFVNAVLVVANSPMWEKKVRLFESFGFSEEDVLSLLRRHPHRLDYSEERLRSSIEYLVNTMKLNPQTIGSRPDLLGYSIDKRLRPRYNVLKLLLSKKLLGEGDAKLLCALVKTEEHFLKDYVYKHLQQVPSLLEVYKGERITNETT